ncbi:MAG: murein transglycosylase A [Deltaproteobacteria bacterium]|nr:murein transglycosylase A [Deltaproteobacteria bacterium]
MRGVCCLVVGSLLAACNAGPEATAAPSPPTPPAAPAPAPPAPPAGPGAPQPCLHDDTAKGPAHDTMTLTRVAHKDLPGWADDKQSEAVPSFLRSCEKLAAMRDDAPVGVNGHGGFAYQWRAACAAAKKVPAGDDAAAKKMFESEFVAWQVAGKAGVDGLLTAYNVQPMKASRKKGGKFQTPVFARPKDLAMIDLSLYVGDAHGRKLWGKFDANGEIVPYLTRPEIRKGALAGKGLEIMYVADPVDLLFAHIEGSAKAVMDDGTTVWLEFAGKNGRAYKGVGGVLKEMGVLTGAYNGTMQGIRKWFHDNMGRFDEVVDQVTSYVFFKESAQAGAVGTQMTILTPERSLAVDRAFIALSTPAWVDTRAPVAGKVGVEAPFRKLLIAQDTGGAITNAVRGDIYMGDTEEAVERAGRMGAKGRVWLLLPKGVAK